MTKKRKKKNKKKRNLKYGNAPGAIKETVDVISDETKKENKTTHKETVDIDFKNELRKNIIFVGIFFLAIVMLYFILTRTDLLNPFLQIMGLENLYE